MKHPRYISSTISCCLRAAVVVASLVAVASGGCSSSDEKRRASQLAGGCAINSDCEKDLICAFERCHIPCTADRDCLTSLRCVKSEETGIFVCQLEEEQYCESDRDCPGEQRCGVDSECRDPCERDGDCVADQVCAASNECASILASKDKLDAADNIIPDGDPTAGGGGTGGSAGEGSGPTPEGGHAGLPLGTSAGGASDPMESGGASGAENPAVGGEAGTGASTEGGGPSLPLVEFEETHDGVEKVNNDDRDHAIPITQSARFYVAVNGEGSDDDWFAYHAPDDGRAHILTLLLEQETPVSAFLEMFMAEDNTQIGGEHIIPTGTTRSVYVTVGPGTTTHFRFDSYVVSGSRGYVTLTLTDQVEQDDYEPNNTRQTAKSITLGQAVTGQWLDPQQSSTVDLAQDWFAIDLAEGTATFTFASLPSEGRVTVDYVPPGTVNPITLWSPPTGALESAGELTNLTAGTYYFNIRQYNESAVLGASYNVKPAYYDEQYSFTITQ
jgi:hypothetical protein